MTASSDLDVQFSSDANANRHQTSTRRPTVKLDELPQFPVGSSEVEIEQLLGQPDVSHIISKSNTELSFYNVIPEQVRLGYTYDRDSRKLRQTRATMDPEVPLEVMERMLDGLLGEPATEQAYQKLAESRSGRRLTWYKFEQGSAEGLIARTMEEGKRKVLIAIWEAGLY